MKVKKLLIDYHGPVAIHKSNGEKVTEIKDGSFIWVFKKSIRNAEVNKIYCGKDHETLIVEIKEE